MNSKWRIIIFFCIKLTFSDGSSNSFFGNEGNGTVELSDGRGAGKPYTSFNNKSSNLNFLLISLLSSFFIFLQESLFNLQKKKKIIIIYTKVSFTFEKILSIHYYYLLVLKP